MSIDAIIKDVIINKDRSGQLILTGENKGQSVLNFDSSPQDVSSLKGFHIWGGSTEIMIGTIKIANRIGYTKIQFLKKENNVSN